ncbi:hypothetical protein [Sphingomonas radiodurans]|uniref:hypothetical protein n=1 Tax=Sphingomonas radiodurans TaxID=2890321 RepID=UPI001E65724C|nr:hypothetical protein [Sphingomonas radiodurans]WBH16728.1 hypothetical protein LLW23_00970 [Sphingomonas radiodurans]
MPRLDYFTGASERWQTDARVRARRVLGEHADDPIGYAQKRIDRSRFGTFERRRWVFIRKVLVKAVQEQALPIEPLGQA